MLTIYAHLDGLENAMMEIEEMPSLNDTILVGRNPRRRDGKDLDYVLPEVNILVFPMNSIKFLEILPSGEEDDFETFIRE